MTPLVSAATDNAECGYSLLFYSLSATEEKRKLYLHALGTVTRQSRATDAPITAALTKAKDFAALSKALTDKVLIVKQKPALAVEGLLALVVLTNLAAVSEDVSGKLQQDKVWEFSLGNTDSFLVANEYELVDKLDERSMLSLMDLLSVLIIRHLTRVSAHRHICDLVIVTLLKQQKLSKKSRVELLKTIEGAVAQSRHISPVLLESATQQVIKLCKQVDQPLKKSLSTLTEVPHFIVTKVPFKILGRMVQSITVAQEDAALTARVLVNALLLAHHPAIVHVAQHTLWTSIYHKLYQQHYPHEYKLYLEHVDALKTALFSEQGLVSPHVHMRLAAVSVLHLLASTASRPTGDDDKADADKQRLIDSVVQASTALIDPEAWFALKSEDISVFNTPEGQLYKQITVADIYKNDPNKRPGAKREKATQAKGKKEEDWEVQKRLEREKKQQQEEEEKALAVLVEEQRRVEHTTRQQVFALFVRLQAGLLALRYIAAGSKTVANKWLHTQMFSLVPRVFALSSVSTYADLAGQTLAAFVHTSVPNQGLAHQLSRSLLSLSRRTRVLLKDEWLTSLSHTPIFSFYDKREHAVYYTLEDVDVLRTVNQSSAAQSPSGYALLQPVIAALLEGSVDVSQQEGFTAQVQPQSQALNAIELHLHHTTSAQTIKLLCYITALAEGSLADLQQTLTPNERKAQTLLLNFVNHGHKALTAYHLQLLHRSLLHPSSYTRQSAAQALASGVSKLASEVFDDQFVADLWLSRFDAEADIKRVADQNWAAFTTNFSRNLPQNYFAMLSAGLMTGEESTRRMVACGIVGAIELYPESYLSTMQQLFVIFNEHSPSKHEKERALSAAAANQSQIIGRVTTKQNVGEPQTPYDWIMWRWGVAETMRQLATLPATISKQAEILPQVITFLIHTALLEEHESDIFQVLMEGGIDLINQQGAVHNGVILPVLQTYLDGPLPTSPQEHQARESVVIFMGTVARHLGAKDPRRESVTDKLIEVLETPSEPVQRAISECLVHLIAGQQDRAEQLITRCIGMCINGGSYGVRKGGAYGLAGLVKGLGVAAIKKYAVTDKLLQDGVENKKSHSARQGAMFAFEALSRILGRVFEPYVIHILPSLLSCFGDTSAEVRDATKGAAKAIMSQLRAHGVKLVLPALTKALEDKTWRTKQGAIDLLGSMAWLQPGQLSTALPTIVPKLIAQLTDTHPKVQSAAQNALKAIGSVIKNPEIQVHVPLMLKAVDDATPETMSQVLDALLRTNFVHHIDAPSLSLLMPILDRALTDRSAEVKTKAAQIVGNMCQLTEHKDLSPYLTSMVQQMKTLVMDPNPTTRSTAARALGSLLRGMRDMESTGGEISMHQTSNELIAHLIETIKAPNLGEVERSGAAQGIAEVIGSIEDLEVSMQQREHTSDSDEDEDKPAAQHKEREHRFEKELLPLIMQQCRAAKPYMRQGFVSIFQYLPDSLGQQLIPYIPTLLPVVIQALADETEPVRDAALKAGRAVVNKYAFTALDTLLPILEKGVFDDNWRIRQSSVQLLGDLLYLISTAGNTDDAFARKDLSLMLQDESRSGILAALYMARFDTNAVVRQTATYFWKTIVVNTPKTLRQIISTLMQTIIGCLGSSNDEKRMVASKTLGDVVDKLGERVLPQIIPTLEQGLQDQTDSNMHTRQGVCLGMAEVINSAASLQLPQFLDQLMPSLRMVLCDPLEQVRDAAGQTFDLMYRAVGNKAIDDLLPPLLTQLDSADKTQSHLALSGLSQMLRVRSRVLLPIIVPKLLTPPITAFNARALGSVAEVSGSDLYAHLDTILSTLLAEAGTEDVLHAAVRVANSVREDGHSQLFAVITRLATESSDPQVRQATASLLASYVRESNASVTAHLHGLLIIAVKLLADAAEPVRAAAVQALESLTQSAAKDEASQLNYVTSMTEILDSIADDLAKSGVKHLAGLSLPKALTQPINVYLQVLRINSSSARIKACQGIKLMMQLCEVNALKAYVMVLMGPHIRILSERTGSTSKVRMALLDCIVTMMRLVPAHLRAFAVQLQSILIKQLYDKENEMEVRHEAAQGVSLLLELGAKIDFLLKDIFKALSESTASDVSPQHVLQALKLLLTALVKNAAAAKPSPQSMQDLRKNLEQMLSNDEEFTRRNAAQVTGYYCKLASEDDVKDLIGDVMLDLSDSDWPTLQSGLWVIAYTLNTVPASLLYLHQRFMPYVTAALSHKTAQVREAACFVLEAVLSAKLDAAQAEEVTHLVESSLERLADSNVIVTDSSTDVKVAAMHAVGGGCKTNDTLAATRLIGLTKSKQAQDTALIAVLAKIARQMLEATKESDAPPVVTAAKRALYRVLIPRPKDAHQTLQIVAQHINAADSAFAKNLVDYAKKILLKMEDTDD